MFRKVSMLVGLAIFGTSIFAQDSVTVFTKYYPASTNYVAQKWSMKIYQLTDSSFILLGNQGAGRALYALHISNDGTPLHFHTYSKPFGLFRFHLTPWGDLYAFIAQPDGYIFKLKLNPVQGFDTVWQKQYFHLSSPFITFHQYGQTLVEQNRIYTIGRFQVNGSYKPCVFVLDTLGNLVNAWLDLAAPDAIEGSVVRHPDGDLILAYRTELGRYAVVKISPDFQQVRWARLIQDEAVPYVLVDPQTGYIWAFSDGWGAILDILAFDTNGNLKISKAYQGTGGVVHKALFYEDRVMVFTSVKAFILSRNDGSLIKAAFIGTNNLNAPISVSDVIFTLDSAFVFAANDAQGKFTLVKTNRFLDAGTCDWVIPDTPETRPTTNIQIYTPSFVDSATNFSAANVPMNTPTQYLPLDSAHCPAQTIPNTIVGVAQTLSGLETEVIAVENGIIIKPQASASIEIYSIEGKIIERLSNISMPKYIPLKQGVYAIKIKEQNAEDVIKVIVF